MERRILLIGIGESGAKSVTAFARKTQQSNIATTCLSMDTDDTLLQTDSCAQAISLARIERLYETVQALEPAQLAAWFPCDFTDTQNEFLKALRMDNGAGLWRSKALLQFVRYMADADNKVAFCGIIDNWLADYAGETLELYTVASLAGGTGSALFLPVTLYILQYIRQKVGVKADAKAFLFSPELYADLLSAEQSVKAHANAYAALRELHAVHETTLARDAVGNAPSAIRLKLGSVEDSAVGLLFDAEDIRFRTPDAAPFSAIYLLEKQSGIRTVEVYAEALSDVLVSLCKNTEDAPPARATCKKSPDALLGSILLTKIIYPNESIAASIAATRLADAMRNEWLWLHRAVYHHVSSQDSEHASALLATDAGYCEAVAAFAEEFLVGCVDSAELLGRQENRDDPDTTPLDFSDSAYITAVQKRIDTFIYGKGCELFEKLQDRLAAPQAFSFRKPKTTLADTAEECMGVLKTVYSDALRAFRTHSAEWINAITAPTGALSISENLLSEGGDAVHPVYALVRLCTLRGAITEQTERAEADENYFAEIPDPLPNVYLNVSEPLVSKKCKYGSGEEDRLRRLLDGDLSVRGKTATDRRLLAEDAETVYKNILSVAFANFFRLLLAEIDRVIGSYIAFFRHLAAQEDDVSMLATAALRDKSHSFGICAYISASEADRKVAAASFARSVTDGEDTDIFTPAFYRATERLILADTPVDGIFRTLAAHADTHVQQSHFYRKHLDKNILEVLLSPDPAVTVPEGGSGLRLRKAFHAAVPALKINPIDTGEGTTLRMLTAVQFPESVRTYLEENRETLGIRGADAKSLAENILFAADEYADSIDFTPDIRKNCMYIRKELGNLCLGELELLNEEARPPIGSAACDKALRMMRTQYTEMWNPYLFCDLEKGLPLIRVSLQEHWEQTAIAALLYALSAEQIRIAQADADAPLLYNYLHDGIESEVLFDGNVIPAGKFAKLLQWLRTEGGRIALWGAAAREQFLEDCDSLPSADIGNMRLSEVLDATEDTETLGMLTGWLLPLAHAAEDSETRTRVLRTGIALLAALCDSRLQKQDHAYTEMFRHLLSRITDRFGGDIPAEERDALLQALYTEADAFLPRYEEP